MKKIALAVLACALLLAGCGNDVKTTGRIDTEVHSYYSQSSGQIKEIPVALGQTVKAGDIIAVLDDTAATYNLHQAQQTLIKAQAALAQASEAVEPENIQQSHNQVTIAEQNCKNAKAAYEKADRQYQQQLALYEAGAIALNVLQDVEYQRSVAETALKSAEAQWDSAKQQLALVLKKQTSSNQIKMAQADVKQAENQVAQLTDALADCIIRAEKDGTILSLSYREGAVVTMGSHIADTSIAGENYWIGYVNSEDAETLQYGQQVTIQHNKTEEPAQVCYVDLKTQYAPEEFQTASNSNRKTIKVKCRLTTESTLQPGQEAIMIFDKTASAQE